MEWADRLADAPSPTMTMLPDGSIDRRYGVLDRDHAPKSREAFTDQLVADRTSFVTEHGGVSPGGQAVNAAMQANHLDADAVVWGNWASLPAATTALERVAARPGDGEVFVLDPGEVSMRSTSEIRGLFAALASLSKHYEVAMSVNGEELQTLGEAIGVGGDLTAKGTGVRDHAGLDHVVMHGTKRALAVTDTGVFDVSNYEMAEVARFTGGGDRFSAALGFGLACGWGWPDVLELCNACASYYVRSGLTADRADLATYVSEATDGTTN